MLVVIVLNVFVGVLPALEFSQNETYAGGKAERNFTGTVSQGNESESVNASGESSQNKTGMESSAVDINMANASRDDESQSVNVLNALQSGMSGGAVESVGPTKMEDMFIKFGNSGENTYKVEVTDIYRTLYDTNKVRFTGHINFTWGPGLGMECEDIVLRSCLVVDNGLDNGYGTNFELTVNGGNPDYSGITDGYQNVGGLIMSYSGMGVETAFMETGIFGNLHYGGGEAVLRWNNIELLTNFEKDFDFTIEAQDVTGIRMFGGLKITTGHYEGIAMASAIQNVQPTVYANAPSSYLTIIMDAFIGLLQTIADKQVRVGSNIAFWIPNSEATDPDAEDGYWDVKYEGDTTSPSNFTQYQQGNSSVYVYDLGGNKILSMYVEGDGYGHDDEVGYRSDPLLPLNGQGAVVEFRVVTELGSDQSCAYVILDNQQNFRAYVMIKNDKVILDVVGGGTYSTTIKPYQFHVYRLVQSPLNAEYKVRYELYIDGALKLTSGWTYSFSGKALLMFGLWQEYSETTSGWADWDFLHAHKNYEFTPPDPTPDNTPPMVSITSPENNQTISGVHTCTVSASDSGGSGLTEVEYYVDGKLAGTNYSSPFSFDLNTTKWTAGSHTLKAKAYDGDGNWNWSQNITVDVKAFPEVPAISPLVFILVLISLFVFGAATIRKTFK